MASDDVRPYGGDMVSSELSRLSVSKPSSSSRRAPLRIFDNCAGLSSKLYHVSRNFASSESLGHTIVFEGRHKFTVDGGEFRYTEDPKNAAFLESIDNKKLPEEFTEDGSHAINVVVGWETPKFTMEEEASVKKDMEKMRSLEAAGMVLF